MSVAAPQPLHAERPGKVLGAIRVVHVKDYFLPIGGAEQFIVQLAIAAQTRGYKTAMVLRSPVDAGNKYVAALREAGIPVYGAPRSLTRVAVAAETAVVRCLQVLLSPVYALRKRVGLGRAWQRVEEEVRWRLTHPLVTRVRDRLLTRILDRLHSQQPVSLVHAHNTDRATPPATRWAARRGIPVVCHDHNGPQRPRGFERHPCTYSRDEIELISRHATIVTSADNITQAAAPAYAPGARIVTVPYWMTEPDPAPRADATRPEFTVGMATRMSWEKGVLVLLDALALLKQRSVPFRCALAGSGPLTPVLPQEVAQRGLEDVVELKGSLSRPEVWAHLRGLDLFVLPSFEFYESVPMCVLEAMSVGLPIVGTAIGGMREVVRDGINGLLVPEGDAQALAEAIATLAKDPERRARMGRASREIYEREWNESAVWPRWEALYASLNGERPSSPASAGGEPGIRLR